MQYLLQYFEIFAILIAKSQSIAKSIAKFQKYCNTLQYYWNQSPKWKPRPRTDLILLDESSFTSEITKDLRIDDGIDPTISQSVIKIIHDNLDSFCEQGADGPMIDFDFCLDTGDSKPVCCRQSSHGIHERKIMNTHIQILEDNVWICDCEGDWGSLLILASKSHQEGCTDINDFVWRLCVSYRPLNGVTKSFEYPIPQCSDSIEDFGDFSGKFVLFL